MAGGDDGYRIGPTSRPHRTGRFWSAKSVGQLPIGDCSTVGDLSEPQPDTLMEGAAPKVDWQRKVLAGRGEILAQLGTCLLQHRTRGGQLATRQVRAHPLLEYRTPALARKHYFTHATLGAG